MTQQEALKLIETAAEKALDQKPEPITLETDLVEDGIMDSLDSLVFFMELGELSRKKFPEDDLVELGLYNVGKLVQFMMTPG